MPRLSRTDTSGARHLAALDTGGARHLCCERLLALNGNYYATPVASRYSAYAARGKSNAGTISALATDHNQLAATVQGGLASGSWVTGHKAMCTYWSIRNSPWYGPQGGTNSVDFSDVGCVVVSHQFNLFGLPAAYTISSAKIVIHKPGTVAYQAPINPGLPVGGFGFQPIHTTYAPYTFGVRIDAALPTVATALSAQFTADTRSYVSKTPGANYYPFIQAYNFWNHANITGGAFGYVPSLYAGSLAGGYDGWLEVNVPSAQLATINANRKGGFWLSAARYPSGNVVAFYDSGSSNGAYGNGVVIATHAGAFILKLAITGPST
jgi:hypothetical protein